MTNYKSSGDVLTFVAPSGGVVSGTPLVIEDITVVPAVTALETVAFEGMIRGRFSVPKTAGQTWDVGEKIYIIVGTGIFTTTASTNVLAGIVAAAAESAATTGEVVLDGVAR
jgi:predicted RecA/RadA family phage recombinase